MIRTLTLIAVLLAAPASAKTVTNDRGGAIDHRLTEIAALRSTGEPVVISGWCASSCTLYLGLPNTCVKPSAKLGFHGPRLPMGLPMTASEFDRLSRDMAAHYPPQIAEWFMRKARHKQGSGTMQISGSKAIKMGVRKCK